MRNHDTINIVSIGHAQHGKSTVMGLLVREFRDEKYLDTLIEDINHFVEVNSVPELRHSLIFDLRKKDYQWLKDKANVLEKKMPLETATKTYSRTPEWLGISIGGQKVMLIDEPGHPDFIRFIVGPTSQAHIGIVVVDVKALLDDFELSSKDELLGDKFWLKESYKHEVVRPSVYVQKRQGDKKLPMVPITLYNYLSAARVFGVRKFIVLIHAMDKVSFDKEKFELASIHAEDILESSGISAEAYYILPTSVMAAENRHFSITRRSERIEWYDGKLLEELIIEFVSDMKAEVAESFDNALRMQIDTYRVGKKQLYPRFSGLVLSGTLNVGDNVRIEPSGIVGRVEEIRLRDVSTSISQESYIEDVPRSGIITSSCRGQYITIGVESEQLRMILRKDARLSKKILRKYKFTGQIVCTQEDMPRAARKFKAEIRFIPPWQFDCGFSCRILHGYAQAECQVKLVADDIGNAIISTTRTLAIDSYGRFNCLGKFILERDKFFIAGGTIREVSG